MLCGNIDKIKTPLQAIKKMYSPLPTLHAIGNLPKILINETLLTAHNKKITPQRRLYATRNELKIFHEKIVSRNEATR